MSKKQEIKASDGTERRVRKSTSVSSPVDGLNLSIIKLLQVDGRLPYKEIAAKLSVSEGTIRNRVNWMKESGMLSIVAIADPTAINYRSDAMLGIKVSSGGTPAEVAKRLGQHAEVVYALWVSGRYDLLVEIVSDDEADFLNFLSEHIFHQGDIAHVEVMKGMAMFKNQFLLKREFD